MDLHWSLFAPEGIQKQFDTNELAEAERRDLENNRLGHLFLFERAEFPNQIKNVPSELRWELVAFWVKHLTCPDGG